ncbi:MAG: hypothetical protein E6490_10390 [Bifidobacterium longum]|nr:hypothetical protein [Bifidobacterium longum]
MGSYRRRATRQRPRPGQGRQVRKGEHGIQIIGHSTVVAKDKDGKPILD